MTTYSLFKPEKQKLAEAIKMMKASIITSITQVMEQRGINQSKVASLCGMKRAHVSRILNGKVNVTLETLDRIANGLDFKWTCKLVEMEKKPYIDVFDVDTKTLIGAWKIVADGLDSEIICA